MNPGTALGHYVVDVRLGSGGMGVVYRARDQRLQRTVAIKVIDEEGAGSAGEHARLLDEARAASGLNHPNICTVYEVGEVAGRPFIVMEYVEGQTLGQSIPHGGLPLETVVRYGTQIADALAHSHGRGVVHRDLKSANVVVGPSAVAKVLDFGLARRVQIHGADEATQSIEVAEPAGLAGTLAYVAPEVLLGEPADPRSDVWAIGVMLYEMATGELPFKGRTEFDLTAAILRAPAEPFPAHVPPILRGVILRCLAKEPAQRYQQAGEVRAALEAIQSDLTALPAVVRDHRPISKRPVYISAAVALAALAGAALWVFWPRAAGPWERAAEDGVLTRVISSDDRAFDPALSADGGMLAYIVDAKGRVDLYAGRVRGGARIRLTDDAALEESPKFSPDGERIAFTRRTGPAGLPEIRVIPALGGDVLATIPRAAFPAWAPDGQHLVFVRRGDTASELTIASSDGSNARVILAGDSVYPFLRNPAWSPDGRTIAVVRGTGGVAGEIWLVPASGGAPVRAIDETPSASSDWPVFTADGRGIVHSSSRGGATNIWFLPVRGGRPVRLTTGPGPDESPTVAADGAIAFVNSRWRNTLEAHDLASGTVRTLFTHTPFIWAPAISPDGRQVAFSRGEVDGSWHLWTLPASGGSATRLTSSDAGEVYPRWSPDGAFVYFNTWPGSRRIGRVPARGGAPVMLTFTGIDTGAFADVAPDGRRIAFAGADATAERVYIASVDGGEPRLLTSSSASVPRWSPDGAWIAFAGNRGYSAGISVIGVDGSGERRLTTDGGWPVWWPDGKRIGYLSVGADGNQIVKMVPVDGGTPETLTSVKLEGTNHPFAISPDGRTIVISNAVHVSDEIWLLEPKR